MVRVSGTSGAPEMHFAPPSMRAAPPVSVDREACMTTSCSPAGATSTRLGTGSGLSAATLLVAALASGSMSTLHAGSFPPGIADPDAAVQDPTYADPVFWWRISSMPKDVYEPDPYFYWPPAVIAGRPGPWLRAAPPGRTTLRGAALEEASRWAEARRTNALIVIHRGVVQLERYWNGMQPDELANGRALTRSVTPLLLGFAVADGRVALDDPIGRHIREWRDDPRGRITVRQLAQNVSGLEVAPSLPVTVIFGNKDLCLAYCGDVVRAALSYAQSHEPGSRFDVAQQNMQLLALVIERATGQPIERLLSERVWTRIGARDAAFQLDRPGGVARVMCCMRATPRDWARLGLLIAQDGRWQGEQILPRGWVATMATPSARNPNFGLGLWLGTPYVALRPYFEGQPGVIPQSEPFVVDDVRIMEGGGFRTIFVSPSRELVVLRHGQIVPDWDNAALVNRLLR
jgi:CubicO group peptidase (beta-lactamase class C family)